jgi:Caspase domain
LNNIAILIANANYSTQHQLKCCLEDIKVMRALVDATGRYQAVVELVDVDANSMRGAIRSALNTNSRCEEVLFYFSGHGGVVRTEFFLYGTEFNEKRPHETGLAHTELQDLLRSISPTLVVSVIDACNAGTALVKSNPFNLMPTKEGFRNYIQFASSLATQNSAAGYPLSRFTRAFCDACLRKTEGPIYYSEVMSTLRDDFIDDEDQTPFFVSQGTGRETLADDANVLRARPQSC